MITIDEVHIAPLGYEYDRILGPAQQYNINIIYLLEHNGSTDVTPNYHSELKQALTNENIEIRSRDVDFLDIYDVLGTVTTLVSEHNDDIVRVNVSSGSKLSAVGATIACMATDATAYYVYPEGYTHADRNECQSYGYTDDEVLPSYPIESPSPDQVTVMNFLDSTTTDGYTPKKKDIIEYAEDKDLSFLSENQSANDKAKFALLNTNIIDPLEENGHIEVRTVGRQKQVILTSAGKNILYSFKYKL